MSDHLRRLWLELEARHPTGTTFQQSGQIGGAVRVIHLAGGRTLTHAEAREWVMRRINLGREAPPQPARTGRPRKKSTTPLQYRLAAQRRKAWWKCHVLNPENGKAGGRKVDIALRTQLIETAHAVLRRDPTFTEKQLRLEIGRVHDAGRHMLSFTKRLRPDLYRNGQAVPQLRLCSRQTINAVVRNLLAPATGATLK